jgi:peptidoglycan/xylan/chitin deacetylase (PgdA/CDA1 family)
MMLSSKKSIIFVFIMRYYKVSSFIQRYFYRYMWRMTPSENAIYLTFDDGPNDIVTPQVLEILSNQNVPATFFCVGENIQKYPTIVERIVSEGHSIGNHTHNHIKGWNYPSNEYLLNVEKAQFAIQPFANTTLFRPPYGRISKKQGTELIQLGFKIVMWDILSYDYNKHIHIENCIKNISKKTRNGSIIVFHDSLKAQAQLLQILPIYIENMIQKGFIFKALPQ